MVDGTVRALRFAKGWKMGTPAVREVELEIRGRGDPVHATLLSPNRFSGPLPSWVVLPGITRPGRKHPTLVRFVRALAASGGLVMVPEVPDWRELLLAPAKGQETLRRAVLALAGREDSAPGRLGVMGFSFGGPQALLAGADPDLIPHLSVAASFGGYCDIERTFRFLFTGEHDWKGEVYHAQPDPYGRWVVGGNFLPQAEGFEGTEPVAEALLTLAREAGDLQVASWEAIHDARKKELEDSLPASLREVFRAFAPMAGEEIPAQMIQALVPALARAALRDSPLWDLPSRLSGVRIPVHLIHGRQDRLIPFSETLRLAETIPPETGVDVSLTRLFSHSRRDGRGGRLGELGEQIRFLNLMSGVLGTL